MIYSLVTAMKPRMLVTFDKDFNALPVSVRVGQVLAALYILLSVCSKREPVINVQSLQCDDSDVWLVILSSGSLVRKLDLQSRGHEFDSWLVCCQVTTLGKLFTHMPLLPSSTIWFWPLGSDALCLGRHRPLHRPGIALAMRHGPAT